MSSGAADWRGVWYGVDFAEGCGLMGYAAHTGTRRNLAALSGAGWGLLLSPGKPRDPRFIHALDNGAWGAFQQGKPFDVAALRNTSALGLAKDNKEVLAVAITYLGAT